MEYVRFHAGKGPDKIWPIVGTKNICSFSLFPLQLIYLYKKVNILFCWSLKKDFHPSYILVVLG